MLLYYINHETESDDVASGAVFTPKNEPKDPFPFFEAGDMPIELDVDDEYVEALTSAKEQDLVDLAGKTRKTFCLMSF